MFRKTAAVLAGCAVLAASGTATNGTRMIGFDAKTVGRGGTTVGVFESPVLLMTNPGGIAFVPSPMLDLSFSLMIPGVEFANPVNQAAGKTNYYPLPGVSYVRPGDELSWGFGLFTQGGMGAEFTLNHDLFRNQAGGFIPQDYYSQLAVMQGGPSLAYKVAGDLAVGVSAHLVYSQLEFRMPYSLAPSIMRGVANPSTGMTFGDMFAAPPAAGGFGYREVTASSAMNDLTAFGFSGKIGLAWQAGENLSVGLSYTSPTALTYKNGTASMDMTAQMGDAFGKAVQGYLMQNPGATLQDAQTAVTTQFSQLGINMAQGVTAQYGLEVGLTLPQSMSLGAQMRATDNLRFAADIEWVNWQAAFDAMDLSLSNGANANINRMMGNNGTFSLAFPLRWKDAVCVRVGAEFDASPDLTLRAGAAFGSNPVPGETLFPVFPAIVENHLMVGGTFRIAGPIVAHVAYEHALAKSQAVSQSTIAQEYTNSTSTLRENIFHFALSWDMR